MRILDELIGQPVAKTMLLNYLAGELPPLLILHGPEGTGRWSAAEALIRQSLCDDGNVCGICVNCRKISKKIHHDYIQFPTEKIFIGDKDKPEPFTVRWLLQKKLPYSPFEGAKRFIIIPQADLIQNEAETALLKTLEETPAHTRFIFLVHNLELLKPTILSRGIQVPFNRLKYQDIIEITDAEYTESDLEFLAGSIHMIPLLTTELYNHFDEKIQAAIQHPLSLIELEDWLISGERNCFASLTGENEFSYLEILESFGIKLIQVTSEHPKKYAVADAVFEFKKELNRNLAGMIPFFRSRLFHQLNLVLHKQPKITKL